MSQVYNLQKLEHFYIDPKSNTISSQIYEMDKLKLQLKNCQDALAKSNQKVMAKEMEQITMERDLRTEARLLEQDALKKGNQQLMIKEMEKISMERELETEARLLEQENTENRFITKKLYKLSKENDELKSKIYCLNENVEKLESDSFSGFPSIENIRDVTKLVQISLEMNDSLKTRIELERNRTIIAKQKLKKLEKRKRFCNII